MIFRNLLEAGDVAGLMAAWGELMPGMPQPKDYREGEISMHMARTSAESVKLDSRAYSHRWLTERDLPSQLPDRLKPSAERLYPVTVTSVGISVNARNEWMKPAVMEVRGAMEYAVNEAYADGRQEPEFVRGRMDEARMRTYRALFG